MCGISGIIKKDSAVTQEEIKKINNIASHRGPDGEGYFLENNLALGHRRLSIIDLSDNGKQPMSYLERYVITFNGEIYNYIELREELVSLGYKFKSKTDTEVILAAYDKWGEGCVNKFNGMWAFAILDKKEKIVFCSRDRFGVKPFYYFSNSKVFGFSSEIKQLLPLQEKNILNSEEFLSFLVFGVLNISEETFFNGIKKLPPSHNLIFHLNKFTYEIKKYYLLKEESARSFKDTFIDSVKLRLRSDVKVGTSLSGGLDSSLVAAVASKFYKNSTEKFMAIHGKSLEKKTDESRFANLLANYSDLDIHTIEPNPTDFIQNIDEVILTQEEPFLSPSIFMQYFVFKKAKELGLKVMLDGQGADEILLGYKHYFPRLLKLYLKDYGTLRFLKEYIGTLKNNKEGIPIIPIKQIFKKIFSNQGIGDSQNKLLINPHDFPKYKDFRKKLITTNLFEFHHKEIFLSSLPALLRYSDKNSMRHSVEARLPFMDYRVIETSVSMNLDKKFVSGWTKFPIRQSFDADLPRKIAWRKCKLGFAAPDKTWLRSYENEMEEEVCNSPILLSFFNKKQMKEIYNSKNLNQRWRFFNAARWSNLFNITY
jgi:asparagine synthase (glutamine-hydrolysing)